MQAAERAQVVAELVESALESEPNRWSAFLDEKCGGDAALRADVDRLLRSHDQVGDFIEEPAYQVAAEIFAGDGSELGAGQLVGDYRVLSLVGEGGMGEVYLAEDTKLGRKVALKLVKPGLGRANLIHSFHREERILAGLNDPHIARLYGGGVTPDGVPYFVMEYVDGERVDAYCDRHQLNLHDRLYLFRKICSAVAYAHQHLVIHRDLKPSNIRVTKEGEPKLLDFGIAKLLEDETATGLTERTITLAGVMTPDYASPEQIRGEAMTTASDVYSLGVILYELLTGSKPYRTKSRRLEEISRAITEQEPVRPSATASNNPKIQNPKSLRGDLDNIVLMAMRKEPSRRYASAGQLSEDLRRHLEGLPVTARKDTIAYRTSKFVARNRIAVAAALLVALAILAGLIAALWEAENARRQRDVAQRERYVAQRERLKAQRINTFLQEMLGAAAPDVKGVDIKVADVLSEASRRARAEMANQPEVMAEVLLTLGRTYISIGLYEPAEVNLRAALEASLKANGELHPTTARSMAVLGLALFFQDKATEGEPLARRAVELQRTLSPEGNEDLGVALYCWGMNLIRKGEPKAAEPVLAEAVELIRKHFGDTHGYYLTSLTALGLARKALGNVDGAEILYRRAIEVGRGVEPRYRIYLAQATGYLGELLTNKGAYSEAEQRLTEAETLYREILGDINSNTPILQLDLGRVYFLKGDYAKAEMKYREALALLVKFFPPESFYVLSAKGALGLTLTRLGKPAEGEPYLREALQTRQKVLAPDSPVLSLTETALGECLLAQKRYAEAEPFLLHGYEEAKANLGEKNAQTIEALKQLHALREVWPKR
ncbi:MAG: hypothetical protein DLM73_13075 [Chthoniobacterales bacterium]|nr:MAG: hypothetical protein DLM73_13075 [Chthoniobacterales bacterium]